MAEYNIDWSGYEQQLRSAGKLQEQEPAPSSPPVNTSMEGTTQMPQTSTTEAGASSSPETVLVNVNGVPEESKGFLEDVVDSGIDQIKAVGHGLVEGYNNTLNGITSLVDFGGQVVQNTIESSGDIEQGWNKSHAREVENYFAVPVPDWLKPNTAAGAVISDITRFAAGFVGVNKLGIIKEGATVGAKIFSNMAKGAMVDLAVTKSTEANLSASLIECFPTLKDSYLEYLATDKDDDALIGRLKMAAEGAGLGVAMDAAGHGVKWLLDWAKTAKAIRKARSAEDLNNIAQEVHGNAGTSQEAAEVAGREVSTEADGAAHVVSENAAEGNGTAAARTGTEEAAEESVGQGVIKGRHTYETLSDEQFTKLVKEIDEGTVDAKALQENTNLSVYALKTERGKKLMSALSNKLSKNFDSNEVVHNKSMETQAKKVYEEYGIDLPKLLENAKDLGNLSVNELNVMSYQIRTLLSGISTTAYDVAGRVNAGDKSLDTLIQLAIAHENTQVMYLLDKNIGTVYGRSLQLRNARGNPEAVFGKGIIDENGAVDISRAFQSIPEFKSDAEKLDWLAAHSFNEEVATGVARNILATGNDPKKLLNALRALKTKRWSDHLNFFFTQNILTGFFTHELNVGNNMFKTLLTPAEHLYGAVVSGNPREAMYAFKRFYNIGKYFGEALQYSASMMKTGVSGLSDKANLRNYSKFGQDLEAHALNDMPMTYDSLRRTLTKGDMEAEITPFQNALLHMAAFLGKPATWNARIMGGEDEFFRVLNFRMIQQENIERKLRSMKVSDKDWKDAFAREEADYMTEDGLVNMSNPDAANAYQSSLESVFAQDPGPLVEKISTVANHNLATKMCLPFVRTVANVFTDSIQHVPAVQNFFSSRLRDELASGDPAKVMLARGKIATAWTTALSTMYLAMDGRLTGAAPKDTKERQAWERAGKLPYSIKVGDTWVQYQRLTEPLAMTMGMIANLYQVFTNDKLTEDDMGDMVGASVGAITAVITDKSFLSGLMDIMSAIQSGDPKKFSNVMMKNLHSMIPASGAFNQASWIADDRYRDEPNGFMEKLGYNSVTKFLQNLELISERAVVKKDWVTGEAMHHSYLYKEDDRSAKVQAVTDELATIARQVHGEPQRKIENGAVELTDEQYQRLCELHGTMKLGGKTMVDRLYDLFNSPQYDKDRKKYLDEPTAKESHRSRLANNIIGIYRDRAMNQLKKEFPDIRTQQREARMERLQARRGRPVVARPGQQLSNSLGEATKY